MQTSRRLTPRCLTPRYLACYTLLTIAAGPGVADDQTPDVYQLTYGQAAEVQMDARRLEDAESLISNSVADCEIPGAVILVARRGKIVLHKAFGWRDVDHRQPMSRDSLFRMASNSKAITAAGILLLVEDGKIGLDQPIGEYLPAFEKDSWAKVTIRQLLTHTGGVRIKPLFLSPLREASDSHPDARGLILEVNRFSDIAPAVEPGTTYSYSNASYNTLAAVIEQLAGSYQDHLRTRIYDPLGMADSCNHESQADHSRMSTVMHRKEDGIWRAGWTPGDAPDYPFPRGSGGMVSSARDYAVFCQMMLNGGTYGGQRVLDQTFVRLATNPQSTFIPAAKAYGLGWKVLEEKGTFSHTGSDGTFAWVDPQLDVVGLVLVQAQGTTIPRRAFRELVSQACIDVHPDSSDAIQVTEADGFYKDIFMSGGASLTSRKTLHAAESLGLTYEYYAGGDPIWQNRLLIGTPDDENGVLLYPDGQPRFRMLYVNGGGATKHGMSLTRAGRTIIRQFNRNGGSYCGSCAGSFLSGQNVDDRDVPRLGYLHLFPYNTLNTGLKKTRLGHFIPDDSPLLRYRSFGDDQSVEDIYHNNGNWLSIAAGEHLRDTEILATYLHPDHKTDGGAAIWAYRKDHVAGRIVNIGSHPEGSDVGEKLALTEACFLYALSGTGVPPIKGTLENGRSRKMNRSSSQDQPRFARIGDRQYHHFSFDVPADETTVCVEVRSQQDADLHLFLVQESRAFRNNAEHLDVRSGANKKLERKLAPGKWFVSVQCTSTVRAKNDPDCGFYRYFDNRNVLNGIAYTIEMTHQESEDDDAQH